MSRRAAALSQVRLTDVAAACDVSSMTVSRVLSEPERVAEPTRRKVLAAIRRLGYLPNANARSLASKRSRIVAAIVPTIAHSIYAATLHELASVLRGEGMELMVGVSDYDQAKEQALVEAFLGRSVDALVLTGVEHTPATRRLLKARGLPVAEIWDLAPRPIDVAVGFSNLAAGAAVGELLASLGRRRLAFIGAAPTYEHRSRKRMEGLQQAAERFGLAPPSLAFLDGAMAFDQALAAARGLLADGGIDAVFCANDMIACALLQAAREHGRAVPDALAVVGFGDFELALVAQPTLSTVRIPGARIGTAAGQAMAARLRGDPEPGPHIDLGYELVRRASA